MKMGYLEGGGGMLTFRADALKYSVQFYETHWKTASKHSARLEFEGVRSNNIQGLALVKKYNSIHKLFLIVSGHRSFPEFKGK